jgi:hypothetical protein
LFRWTRAGRLAARSLDVLPRQVFLVFVLRSAATTIGFPFVFIRPARRKYAGAKKSKTHVSPHERLLICSGRRSAGRLLILTRREY